MSLLDACHVAGVRGIERRRGLWADLRVLTDEQTPDWDRNRFLQIRKAVGRAIRYTPGIYHAVRALQAMDTACLQAMYTTKSSFMY